MNKLLESQQQFPTTRRLLKKIVALEHDKTEYKGLLVLMRGASGSGKSMLAELLSSVTQRGIKLSTDDYFLKDGGYQFNPSELETAHNWNYRRFMNAIESGQHPIVVDNTNIVVVHMLQYAKPAIEFNYDIEICETNTTWKTDPKILERKSVHGVPKFAIERMLKQYEKIDSADLYRKAMDIVYPDVTAARPFGSVESKKSTWAQVEKTAPPPSRLSDFIDSQISDLAISKVTDTSSKSQLTAKDTKAEYGDELLGACGGVGWPWPPPSSENDGFIKMFDTDFETDPYDGTEDYISLVLPSEFVSQLVSRYADPEDDLNNLSDEMRTVKLPMRMTYELFNMLCCKKQFQQSAEDELFARQLADMDINCDPRQQQEIMDLEIKMSTRSVETMEPRRNQIQQTLAQKLTLQKFQEAFPKVSMSEIRKVYERNDFRFDNTLKQLKSRFPNDFVEEGLSDKFKPQERKMVDEALKMECEVLKNTSSEGENEMDGRSYRDRALYYHGMRMRYKPKVVEAMRNKCSGEAYYYLQLYNRFTELMNRSNTLASRWYIKSRNPDDKPYELDLHFQYVQEALRYTIKFIRNWLEIMERRGDESIIVKIVTGRGMHSADGYSPLNHAIGEFLKNNNFRNTAGKGFFTVTLTKENLKRGAGKKFGY